MTPEDRISELERVIERLVVLMDKQTQQQTQMVEMINALAVRVRQAELFTAIGGYY